MTAAIYSFHTRARTNKRSDDGGWRVDPDSFFVQANGCNVTLLASELSDLEDGLQVVGDCCLSSDGARALARMLIEAADQADKSKAR